MVRTSPPLSMTTPVPLRSRPRVAAVRASAGTSAFRPTTAATVSRGSARAADVIQGSVAANIDRAATTIRGAGLSMAEHPPEATDPADMGWGRCPGQSLGGEADRAGHDSAGDGPYARAM